MRFANDCESSRMKTADATQISTWISCARSRNESSSSRHNFRRRSIRSCGISCSAAATARHWSCSTRSSGITPNGRAAARLILCFLHRPFGNDSGIGGRIKPDLRQRRARCPSQQEKRCGTYRTRSAQFRSPAPTPDRAPTRKALHPAHQHEPGAVDWPLSPRSMSSAAELQLVRWRKVKPERTTPPVPQPT